MRYDKLVRDRIPEVIRERGGNPTTHVAGEAEYWLKLREKLSEEVAEFLAAENMEEMADILEVLDAIAAHKGFSHREVRAIKHDKAFERGRFTARIILEES
jgi:predicted house-cleaning noncanonical NTP pyrophosphatase (MazG superfamily)